MSFVHEVMQIKQLVGHFHINLEGKTGKFLVVGLVKINPYYWIGLQLLRFPAAQEWLLSRQT